MIWAGGDRLGHLSRQMKWAWIGGYLQGPGSYTALRTCSRTREKTRAGSPRDSAFPSSRGQRKSTELQLKLWPLQTAFQVALKNKKHFFFFTHLSRSKCVCSSTGIYREELYIRRISYIFFFPPCNRRMVCAHRPRGPSIGSIGWTAMRGGGILLSFPHPLHPPKRRLSQKRQCGGKLQLVNLQRWKEAKGIFCLKKGGRAVTRRRKSYVSPCSPHASTRPAKKKKCFFFKKIIIIREAIATTV